MNKEFHERHSIVVQNQNYLNVNTLTDLGDSAHGE